MSTARDAPAGRPPAGPAHRRGQRGLTLVELVVALVLAGIVTSALWSTWALLGCGGADPLVRRQQLAVAQALLREIELQPMPGTAVAAATPGRTGFASIADYDGLSLAGITDVEGNPVTGLEPYGATVTVQPMALDGVPASDGYWITVRVTGPGTTELALAQWRVAR